MRQRQLTTLLILAAVTLPGARAAAQETSRWQLVHRAKDSSSGAELRVFKGAAREMQVDIEGAGVLVRKRMRPGAVELVLASGAERVSVSFEAGALTVTGPSGTARATTAAPGELSRARAILVDSRVLAKAVVMVGKVGVRKDTPVYQMLLSTRAILESALGRRAAAEELADWSHGLKSQPAARRIAFEQEGPGDCWALYSREAIAAYIEYESCMMQEQWWDIFGQTACAFIYDLRALGAAIWWLNCIGAWPL
jgi:hypothetical protein